MTHTHKTLVVSSTVHPTDKSSYVEPLGGRPIYFRIKRLIDVVLGLAALIVLAPVMLILAILIRLDSKGSVIFSQERIGGRRVRVNGDEMWEMFPFTIYKFRTMSKDASHTLHHQFVTAFIKNDAEKMRAINAGEPTPDGGNTTSEDTREAQYKIKADPRVTRIGSFLRKSSLDELPQLINVIKGDMSLVGPRPALRYEVEEYENWHKQRFAAKQGMTGYWQVVGRSEVSFAKMVELDIWYAKHQNILLDLKILFLTPLRVFKGKGAE